MATDLTEQTSNMKESKNGERKSNSKAKRTVSITKKEWFLAIGAGIFLWAAFPPIGCWPLAFVAPAGWIRFAKRDDAVGKSYFKLLFLAGFVHWLLLTQWIRLPHILNVFGWLALAAYLALYIPLFVVATRTLICRWRIPSVLAAPIVWTGFELLRGYLFTGFSISLIGHALAKQTMLIQISDTFGAYGVSFIVIAMAAAVEELFPLNTTPRRFWPLGVASLLIALTMGYGNFRLQDSFEVTDGQKPAKIALIQGVFDTVFDNDLERERIAGNNAFADYQRLSEEAIDQYGPLDLIVWPESMFSTRYPVIQFSEPLLPVPGSPLSADELVTRFSEIQQLHRYDVEFIAALLKTPLLVGSERMYQKRDQVQRYNSALLISTDGTFKTVYDKTHPVMFGEYIPFGQYAPWIYNLTPMGRGLTAGKEAVTIELGGVRLAPCICFENTIPQLIRRQTADLREKQEPPDCLITITNDGWFWGSSLLDVHFVCGVFRAIEMRIPMIIAANTGFSGWIDGRGRVLEKGGRREEGIVVANILPATKATTPYQQLGDLPFILFCFPTVLAILDAARRSRQTA